MLEEHLQFEFCSFVLQGDLHSLLPSLVFLLLSPLLLL